MKYLKLYKHLLPRGRAWSLIADKPLRRFFLGLALVWEAVEQYLGEIYFDLFVGSTRALDEWDEQFGFTQKIGTDSRLARLSAAWKASGGQSPRYIQDTLQAAGFDVYVHEWWEPEFLPGTTIEYTGTNLMPSPFDPSQWYGVAVDPDLSYTSITEPNPSGESFVGEFEYVGTTSTATFTFSNNTVFNIGDKLYTACLLGKNGYSKIRHIVQEYPSAAVVSDFRYDFLTDTVERNTAGISYRKTDINDDYCIVETEYIAATNGEHRGGIWGEPDSGAMPVGAKLKMQAAYFGKADDWPATLISPLPNPKYTPPPNLTPRNPLLLLADDSQDVVYYVEAGEPLAQAGEPLAQAGQAITPVGFPLVNKVTKVLTAGVEAGEPLAQAGEPLAQAGEIFGYRFRPRTYDLPTDPALWPYFLYIGGEKFGTTASVDTTRRAEFERLCLKICPLQLWLGMLVTYE